MGIPSLNPNYWKYGVETETELKKYTYSKEFLTMVKNCMSTLEKSNQGFGYEYSVIEKFCIDNYSPPKDLFDEKLFKIQLPQILQSLLDINFIECKKIRSTFYYRMLTTFKYNHKCPKCKIPQELKIPKNPTERSGSINCNNCDEEFIITTLMKEKSE